MTTNSVGKRIKFVRTNNLESPVRFAKKIGVDWRFVPQWENDEAIPEMSALLKITKLFNVSVDWLKDGESAG